MSYKYIVVDDEPLIREGTITKLKDMPDVTCVAEAGNGKEALEKIEELQPDIVIMDMKMPVMDGVELLQHLTDEYSNLKFIVISGYKSFDFLKQAVNADCVDYLLKPFSAEQIQTVVQQAVNELKDIQNEHLNSEMESEEKDLILFHQDIQFLTDSLMGYEPSTNAISSKRLSFLSFSKRFCLYALYSSALDPEDISGEKALPDSIQSERCVYLKYPPSDNFGIVLYSLSYYDNREAERADIHAFAKEILNKTNPNNGICEIGVSNPFETLSGLHEAFLQAKNALNQIPYQNTTSNLYFYEEQKEQTPLDFTWDKLEEFVFRVETGNIEALDRLLSDLYAKFETMNSLNLSGVKHIYYAIANRCADMLTHYFNTGISPSESSYRIVSDIYSADQLHAYYKNYFHNLASNLEKQNIFSDRDVIDQIKLYVQYHYAQDLSLDWIASLFYLNSNYLSHLFHKKTGMRYTSYVTEIRLQKAEDLLCTTDLKTYQIAKMVGFNNIKYFFKIFKKREGVTPEQYRNSESLH